MRIPVPPNRVRRTEPTSAETRSHQRRRDPPCRVEWRRTAELAGEHAARDTSTGARAVDIDSGRVRIEFDALRHGQRRDDTGLGGDLADAVANRRATVRDGHRVECGAYRTSVEGQHRKQRADDSDGRRGHRTSRIPTAQVAAPAIGVVGFLNGIVTNLLNPFLAPAPNTPEPVTPATWAVLGWVRRNFFNQAPTITYNPTTTVQTGQTVTGNIGATDPEGDALTYTVTQGPAARHADDRPGDRQLHLHTQMTSITMRRRLDSFTVSVTDGKFNLLSLFSPHSDQETIDLTVLNPTVERVIVNMPDGITNPVNPRFRKTESPSTSPAHRPAAVAARSIRSTSMARTCEVRHLWPLAPTVRDGTCVADQPSETRSVYGRVRARSGAHQTNPAPRYSILEPDGFNGRGSPARFRQRHHAAGGGATLPGLPAES